MSKLKLDFGSLTRELQSLIPTSHVTTRSTRQETDQSLSNFIINDDSTDDEVADTSELGELDNTASKNEAAIALAISDFSPIHSPDGSDFPNGIKLVGTKYTLRKYQLEGIAYLREYKKRFLTDKPGLGKTIQAICAADLPCLILAPTYLAYNWNNVLQEVAVKASGQTVAFAHGTRAKKLAAIESNSDWTIGNIEMLREDVYFDKPQRTYKTVIIDEAHHIRGYQSQQSLGAIKLCERAERVYLLTATPIFNRPNDLYAQFRLIDRPNFHSYWSFINTHCVTIQAPFGPRVLKARPSLKREFERLSLGRTYEDVKMELPEAVADTIIIDPPEEFKKLYKNLRDEFFVPGQEVYDNALQVLQALRQITAPQKLKILLSLLKDTDALTGTVIFCYYKKTAEAVAELLDIPCVTGDMSPRERAETARTATCLTATLSSMAEGVDLSHLHTVVFFELDYVPGRNYQALSRVRRTGGIHTTTKVYYPIVKDTVDQVLYNEDGSRARTINEIVRDCLT